jgi:hypothetical protein
MLNAKATFYSEQDQAVKAGETGVFERKTVEKKKKRKKEEGKEEKKKKKRKRKRKKEKKRNYRQNR